MAKNPPEKSKQSSQDSQEVITPEVAKVIRDLPAQKRDVIIRALSITQHRSGPLPMGEDIKIYAEVIPDGGDRLMKTVEKQLEHRFRIEDKGVDRTFNQSSTGQWMAFIIAVFFGLISWDLAKNGHDAASEIIGGIDIVGLVAVFITGRVIKK